MTRAGQERRLSCGAATTLRLPLWVRTDKTHCEHNESGYSSIADMRADIRQPPASATCRQARDAARLRTRIFLISSARFPLCERPDIGNFTTLVGPGIDRPEFVGLAILDHCRIVRTLSE